MFPFSDVYAYTYTHPALAFAISAALLVAGYVSWALWLCPLARLNVKGPLQARLGLGWMSSRALCFDFGWRLRELHDHHGAVVRVGLNTVSIADPDAISDLYRHGGGWDKSQFYTDFAAVPGTMMSTLPHGVHQSKRKSQSPAFTMHLLVQLEEYVDSCLEAFTSLLDRNLAGKTTATLDMGTILQLLALDTIGELAFGETFHLCEAGKDTEGYLDMFHNFTVKACWVGTQNTFKPLMRLISHGIWGRVGGNAIGRRAQQCVDKRYQQVVDSKSTGDTIRNDILAKLMSAKHANGIPFTQREVTVAAGSILSAGSDTTAVTLRAVLRYIVEDPKVLQKVLEELDEALAEEIVSFPITYSAGCRLTYFQACLKESLRLHSAVPWILPRVVPKGGAMIAGRWFPGGTEVAMSPYVVHRREEAYGSDALVFKPERWIDADAETKKVMERNLLTFGSGSRVCIGKNISLMEITKVIPTLLHRYRFTFTPRTATSPHTLPGRSIDGVFDDNEPWHVTSQWFAVQNDFFVDVEERAAV